MTRDAFYRELSQLVEKFEHSKPEYEVTLRDSSCGVEGYVVVWNTEISRGGPLGECAKGGTRITPTLSLEEVKRLAKTMAIKNAAASLPLGGAKSGLVADPDSPNIEKQYRRFVKLAKPLLTEFGGPYGGFGFDLGARPQQAIWACDELQSIKSFTGKPRDLGGTDYDKEGIAGIGVAQAALSLLHGLDKQVSESSFAVQGLGAVGWAVVKEILAAKGKIRFISDSRLGGTFSIQGEFPDALKELLSRQDFAGAKSYLFNREFETFPVEAVLYQDVDVLLPCAIQDVIHADNADKIRAKYLVEGANFPCTAEAREFMMREGKVIIPDFIANPGGIIAAFIELSSAHHPGLYSSAGECIEKAKAQTKTTIAANVKTIIELSQKLSVDTVSVAKHIALSKLLA